MKKSLKNLLLASLAAMTLASCDTATTSVTEESVSVQTEESEQPSEQVSEQESVEEVSVPSNEEVIQAAAENTMKVAYDKIENKEVLSLLLGLDAKVTGSFNIVEKQSVTNYTWDADEQKYVEGEPNVTSVDHGGMDNLKINANAELGVNYDTSYYATKEGTNETSAYGKLYVDQNITYADVDYAKGEASYLNGNLNYNAEMTTEGQKENFSDSMAVGEMVDGYINQAYGMLDSLKDADYQDVIFGLIESQMGMEIPEEIANFEYEELVKTIVDDLEKWYSGEMTSVQLTTEMFTLAKSTYADEEFAAEVDAIATYTPYIASILDMVKTVNVNSFFTLSNTTEGYYDITFNYTAVKLALTGLITGVKTATTLNKATLGEEMANAIISVVDEASEILADVLPANLTSVTTIGIENGFVTSIEEKCSVTGLTISGGGATYSQEYSTEYDETSGMPLTMTETTISTETKINSGTADIKLSFQLSDTPITVTEVAVSANTDIKPE